MGCCESADNPYGPTGAPDEPPGAIASAHGSDWEHASRLRDASEGALTTSEDGRFGRRQRERLKVWKAAVVHDINGDPDQFTPPVESLSRDAKQRLFLRVSDWRAATRSPNKLDWSLSAGRSGASSAADPAAADSCDLRQRSAEDSQSSVPSFSLGYRAGMYELPPAAAQPTAALRSLRASPSALTSPPLAAPDCGLRAGGGVESPQEAAFSAARAHITEGTAASAAEGRPAADDEYEYEDDDESDRGGGSEGDDAFAEETEEVEGEEPTVACTSRTQLHEFPIAAPSPRTELDADTSKVAAAGVESLSHAVDM